MSSKITKIILIVSTLILVLATGRMGWSLLKPKVVVKNDQLMVMSVSELNRYDGSQPDKPIYLGYEGLIYDVTEGKEYYKLGGVYHFLAGKDSTIELNFAGGNLIKKKYPVVARLVD